MNPRNNRRANLRLTDKSGNGANRGPNKNSGRLYKGVTKRVQASGLTKWIANIGLLGDVNKYIGIYESIEEAAWMYDQWANGLFGEFARTNFDYHEVPRQDDQQRFDIATYVQKSTQSSGVPLRVKNPQTIAALARKLSQR